MSVTNKEMPQENGVRMLGTKKISSLFWSFTLTAVLGMTMQMAIAIADGFFVGNGIGEIGLATIGIVFPFWITSIAMGTLFGVGASTYVGIKLGEGNKEEARQAVGQIFWFSNIVTIIITVLVFVFIDPIIIALGGQGEIIPSARSYIQVFMLGFPLYVTGLTLYYLVRVDEKPGLGMIIQVIPAAIAIVVEYFLIFRMGAGIRGSAFSAWFITLGTWYLLVFYFIFGKTDLRIRFSDIKIKLPVISEMVKIGFAGFIIQLSPVFVTITINNLIAIHGQEADYAAYGVINAYILYILISFTNAFGFGLLPIASYNFGAKLYDRVKEVLLISLKYTFGFVTICMLLIFLFANQILGFFIGDAPELVQTTKSAMYIFTILFPLGAITMVTSNYFQAVGKNGKAIINSLTRNVIFVLPLLIILANAFGMKGLWSAQPVADLLSALIAVFFIVKEIKALSRNTDLDVVTKSPEQAVFSKTS